MPERKTMVKITRITDHDTGMYQMGEIDGAFQEDDLDDYLESYGEFGLQELYRHLAYLQFQVVSALRRRRDAKICQSGEGCDKEGVRE